jgi:hypothetical protein
VPLLRKTLVTSCLLGLPTTCTYTPRDIRISVFGMSYSQNLLSLLRATKRVGHLQVCLLGMVGLMGVVCEKFVWLSQGHECG